jgi:hypothetical protein
MANSGTESALAPSIERLAQEVRTLGERIGKMPGQAAAPPEQALVATTRFRIVQRMLRLMPPVSTLYAETISASEIKLAWDVEDAEFSPAKLLRCQGENCEAFVEIAILRPEDRSYMDGKLSGNTTYRYKLTVRTARGEETFATAEAKTKS